MSFISTAQSEKLQSGKAGLVHHIVAKVALAIMWIVTMGIYVGVVFLRF